MKIIIILTVIFNSLDLSTQISCTELIDNVKSENYGRTYYSSGSEAISEVTFYEISDDDYNTYYFAIVEFKSSFENYIYQVGSSTELNYSMHYIDSAGKAFWLYIQPYNENLGCAPNFE